jgi:predicted phosphodiesterase
MKCMKIGIISDIHSNYEALFTVLNALKAESVDRTLNADDNVGYSAFPDEYIRLLNDANVEGVMGNYDKAIGHNLTSCGRGKCCEALKAVSKASLDWTQGE